jgi:hypothetical protein
MDERYTGNLSTVSAIIVKTVATIIDADWRRRFSCSGLRFRMQTSSQSKTVKPANIESDVAVCDRFFKNNDNTRIAMRTFIKIVAQLDEPSDFLSEDFRAVVLFSGIGLLVALIAAITGVQGVWL